MAEAAVAEAPIADREPQARVTYEEFLSASDEDALAEWVYGEVVPMSPTSVTHQSVVRFLSRIFDAYVEAGDAGAVFSDTFQMKTGLDLPGRTPDLLFVAREHLSRLHETYLEGPADLVVEVISPESRARDLGAKLYEYQEGGVPEYWAIDPERRQAIFYVRGDEGLYRPAPVDDDGVYRSTTLPGLWVRVDWLWQEPKPALLAVLREWGLV